MPFWWGKPSSTDVKQNTKRRSFIGALHLKFNNLSRGKNLSKSGGSERYINDTLSEKGFALPRSESPSLLASRCQSFNHHPHAHPLPHQRLQHLSVGADGYGLTKSRLELNERSTTLPDSLLSNHDNQISSDAWADLAAASVTSQTSMDTDDQPDSQLLSPLASDYESGNVTDVNSPSSLRHKDQSLIAAQQNSKEKPKLVNLLPNNHIPILSKKRGPSSTRMAELQIPSRSICFSAPDNSLSTLPLSPVRDCGPDQVIRLSFCSERLSSNVNLVGPGQCSSPGSGQNSCDMSLSSPQSRCSPESSPICNSRMTSPCSQRQCGVVSLLGLAAEFSTDRPTDRKAQYHRLPRPPMIARSSCSFPHYLRDVSATLPRDPGCPETLTSTTSCWKKGRLIGSGTYGQVYLGFNSGSGEMCAMKEVPLIFDDAKSIESVQQLEQEINMLSRLSHPNIVRYFGSEMVDDKLYIYLEYVSGGSIYKLLRDYGMLGESAIRSYTQQILSGLAYLHSRKTVHRDIKGANILVDPTGRVKLADFGMAKHITGQPCPLSFKGSPYWMAPEVIINSNGGNLAVDIWSLGCTIIEMATAKPPWSQYEGVAALFKIGNSKELPTIPDHLSEEGKDFVMQCLQRNPLHRPTAAQLLEHRFVKNLVPLQRSLLRSELLESVQPISNAMNYADIGRIKRFSCLETQLSRGFKIDGVSSEGQIPKHLSCPVSPIHSPLLRPRSSQTTSSGMNSPSAVFSPHTASASSTPYTGRTGSPPAHHLTRPKVSNSSKCFPVHRPNNIAYLNRSPLHRKQRLESEILGASSRASRETVSSRSNFIGN